MYGSRQHNINSTNSVILCDDRAMPFCTTSIPFWHSFNKEKYTINVRVINGGIYLQHSERSCCPCILDIPPVDLASVSRREASRWERQEPPEALSQRSRGISRESSAFSSLKSSTFSLYCFRNSNSGCPPCFAACTVLVPLLALLPCWGEIEIWLSLNKRRFITKCQQGLILTPRCFNYQLNLLF